MQHFTIYHNPRCSKSRTALDLLQKQGIEPTIVKYCETPPSTAELNRLIQLAGLSPQDIVRKKESIFEELNLHLPSVSDNELLEAMVKHPSLIERPIVYTHERAIVGRPPERVLELID